MITGPPRLRVTDLSMADLFCIDAIYEGRLEQECQ
jgi:hypothetical protein